MFSGLRGGSSSRGQCGWSWTPRRHFKGPGVLRAQEGSLLTREGPCLPGGHGDLEGPQERWSAGRGTHQGEMGGGADSARPQGTQLRRVAGTGGLSIWEGGR